MKKYGPKVIYRNYLEFVKYAIGLKRIVFTFVLTLVLVGSMTGMLLIFSINRTSFATVIGGLIWGLPLFLSLAIGGFFFLKNQWFEMNSDELVDHWPTTRKYKVRWIERISLYSPYRAHLVIKHPEDSLFRTLYWAGKTEDDWQAFIKDLAQYDPSVVEKIYYNRNSWQTPEYVKVDFDSSYKKVLAAHFK